MAAAGWHLVDELENAFKNSLSALTNQEHYASDQEEVKNSVDQSIQKFMDISRQLECFFLQKRMQLSISKPEQFIKEETFELQRELVRKEELIQKHYEKLAQWQAILNRSQSTAVNHGQGQAAPMQSGQMPSQNMMSHHQQQQQQQQQAGGIVQQPHLVQGQAQAVHHMAAQSSAYQPQGPLHYLEQTTSNIGMPERR